MVLHLLVMWAISVLTNSLNYSELKSGSLCDLPLTINILSLFLVSLMDKIIEKDKRVIMLK